MLFTLCNMKVPFVNVQIPVAVLDETAAAVAVLALVEPEAVVMAGCRYRSGSPEA